MPSHRFCIAPMLDWSDRHCRNFWRLLTRRSLLYTEMITTGALIHGDAERHLNFCNAEHPIAIQLGGSDPRDLAIAAKLCEKHGYDEINLNVGCPSERVKSGAFGACLMNEPETVADCIKSMRDAVSIPVTIKCRTGVDENDSYESLQNFIAISSDAGCETFIIHARKAWLTGLSPKENREIPPLNYPTVFSIKNDFPHLIIVLNGGLNSIDACQSALQHLDGVMVGREAYQNPYLLSAVDAEFFSDTNHNSVEQSRLDIARRYATYIEGELDNGTRLNHMTRHMLGLFNGQPGARKWRRYLSENAYKPGAGIDVYFTALEQLESSGPDNAGF